MSTFKWFAAFVVAITIVRILPAESHCPGNAASVPLRLTNGHQIIVAVSVNHSGPYKFLLDTGTQVTIVDPSLAAELHLNSQGSAMVAGPGFNAAASIAQVDLLEAGLHSVAKQKVLVFGLQHPHAVDLQIRGVLGEDFLSKFDMLIDNDHNVLCLDDSGAMRAHVKGPHIALQTTAQTRSDGLLCKSLILLARLPDGMRPIRLMLDSGTNVSFLFNTSRYMNVKFLRNTSLAGAGLDGAQRPYAALPVDDLQIGPLELRGVSFYTVSGDNKDSSPAEFDGMLPTGLFRSVFVCHTDHFVVLEPR